MEMAEKNRELAAWISIGAVIALLLGALLMVTGVKDEYSGGYVLLSGLPGFMPAMPMIVMALAVGVCVFWREPSRQASVLSMVALITAGAATVLYLIFGFISLGKLEGGYMAGQLFSVLGNVAAAAVICGFLFVCQKKTARPAGAQNWQHNNSFGAPQQQPQQSWSGAGQHNQPQGWEQTGSFPQQQGWENTGSVPQQQGWNGGQPQSQGSAGPVPAPQQSAEGLPSASAQQHEGGWNPQQH